MQTIAIGLLAAQMSFAGQNSFQLAAITVAGSKRYTTAQIVPVTGLTLGQSISLNALKDAANKLASIGVFSQVNYRYQTIGNALTVTFIVQDTRTLLPCSFDNFVWFSPQELEKQLRAQVPLFEGEVPETGDMLELVKAQLQDMLKGQGIKAQVESSPIGQMNGRVEVEGVAFKEVGVPLPIHKIEFTGVGQISPGLLQAAARPLLGTNYNSPFIRAFSGGTIDRVYLERGYLRASFGYPAARLLRGDATRNAVDVTIPVKEGEQYLLKRIDWQGQSVVPYKELAKMVHAKLGRPVDAVALEQDLFRMIPKFKAKGYIAATVKYKPELDAAAHSAICDILVQQGELYYMGNLQITGVKASEARNWEADSRLRRGEPYNPYYWVQFAQGIAHRSLLRTVQKVRQNTTTVDVQLLLSSG